MAKFDSLTFSFATESEYNAFRSFLRDNPVSVAGFRLSDANIQPSLHFSKESQNPLTSMVLFASEHKQTIISAVLSAFTTWAMLHGGNEVSITTNSGESVVLKGAVAKEYAHDLLMQNNLIPGNKEAK